MEPILVFNKETGCYEGTLRIQVDGEFFRRALLRAIEEDLTADLTDPTTWAAKIAQVGKITAWLQKPQTKITPLAPPIPPPPVLTSPSKNPTTKGKAVRPETKAEQLERHVREKARGIPPHLWDQQCITPLADPSLPGKVREDVGRLRYDERQILKRLYQEWEQGTFVLDADAAAQAVRHEEQMTGKLTAIASVVNGNRIK